MALKHVGYKVLAPHYDVVGAALLQTLSDGLQSAFSDEVKNAWAGVWKFLSTTMITFSAYPAADKPKPKKAASAKKKVASKPVSSSQPVEATSEALFKAVEAGDAKLVKTLCGAGAPLEEFNSKGMNVLHVAVICGHEDVVGRLLLQKGKKVLIGAKVADTKDTALHLAAKGDMKGIAVMLVREGAKVTAKNAAGQTCAHFAKGQLEEWMRGSDPAGTKPPWQ